MTLGPQFRMLNIYLKIHDITLREALEELLPQAGMCINENESVCEGILFTPPALESSFPALNFSSLSHPLRFLDLLFLLENLAYNQEITFAHFSLDLREKVLKNLNTQELQRLTEKECQLLRFFHQNQGEDLSKERILKTIWEYHPDVETHTLETHIYRLRQKIEVDQNAPQILLNGQKGYLIK